MPIKAEDIAWEDLARFVRESNEIESITRDPLDHEVNALAAFVQLDELRVADVEDLALAFQPGAYLRRDESMPNVMIGGRICPPGGSSLVGDLMSLLIDVNRGDVTAYEAHLRYEHLHPFLDCNGRTGRAIWLWQMGSRGLVYPFLQRFYYQALQHHSLGVQEDEEQGSRARR